jgi:hypothetical protein
LENIVPIYQILGARLCHDFATPVNALGLILENLDEPVVPLTQQVYEAAVSLLNLYRTLFTMNPAPLPATIKAVQGACTQKRVDFSAKIQQTEERGNIGKIITCLALAVVPILRRGSSLHIEQIYEHLVPLRNTYKITGIAPRSIMDVASAINASNLPENSRNAPIILLQNLLAEESFSVTIDFTERDKYIQFIFLIE